MPSKRRDRARDPQMPLLASSWQATVVLVAILIVVVGASAYLFRRPIISSLGLGIVPVALWLGVFLWTLTARRRWLRRANLWLGSIALVALVLGIMAYFQPGGGRLAGFTLDGEVSLGGKAGHAIIGPVGWLGVLRLMVVAMAGAALVFPRFSAEVSRRFGRMTISAYSSLAAKAKVRYRYRRRAAPRPSTVDRFPSPATPTTESAPAPEWSRPPGDVLVDVSEGGITEEEIGQKAETIRQALADYGVEVQLGETWPGPTVTIYGLVPGWVRRVKRVRAKDEEGRPKLDQSGRPVMTQGEEKTRVRVDSIVSREKDLALALGTSSIRIETPVMGKPLLGIEVPNSSPSLVTLRSLMEDEEFKRLRPKARLPMALGKGSGGEVVVADLADMPHLLIAGATGSGKSICIHTIISCLVMEKTPAELRVLLVDPKRVELTPYNGIPHLLTPVVVETDRVLGLLQGTIAEMMDRYRRMEDAGARNIEGYNSRMQDKMPMLVVAIDELADLMMTAGPEIEQSLCRLAQLGRATGIHLIVATQRPSVDVVTGLIKANFPSRISFGVASQTDSRTILDVAGAEKLLGKGDMLYMPADASRPTRVQGVYVSESEIDSIVRHWRTTPQAPLPKVHIQEAKIGESES